MTELGMRQIVVKALSGLDAFSVENPVRPGTPDVNYIEGWIELKYLERWPHRPSTKIKVPIFTQQQRVWLTRRCNRGGCAYFLILVDKDWLLFDGKLAAERMGSMDKAEMLESCILHCQGTLDKKQLYKVLKNDEHKAIRTNALNE